MKKFRFLWTLMALPLLAACSHDDFVKSGTNNGEIPAGEGVYMTVNFTPFQNTRSYTDDANSSDGGTEVGTDVENKINKVLIVLASKTNEFIASATVDNNNNSSLSANGDGTIYQAKAKFAKTDISQYYTKLIAANGGNTLTSNPSVNVFIYCNPTDGLITELSQTSTNTVSADWYNSTYSLTSDGVDATIWNTTSGFLMTNVSIESRQLPMSFDTWNIFSTENNPFDLSGMNNANTNLEVDNSINGSINVHRMAARFDFRDGSQGIGDSDPIGNGIKGEAFTYKLMTNTVNGEEKVLVKAKLINMSLVNVLNSEYYLERVNTSGVMSNWVVTNTNNTLLGREMPWFNNSTGGGGLTGNYVVTPNADDRISNFSNYYLHPFFTYDDTNKKYQVSKRGEGWDTISMDDIVQKSPDTNYGGNYHIWRYVTENTLGEDNQVNCASTGVVFKAQLLPGDGLKDATESTNYWDYQLYQTLSNTTSNGPVLYSFSGNLYCSWKQVVFAALKSAGYDETKGNNQALDRSATLFKAVFGNGGTGEVTFNLNDGTEKKYAEYVPEGDGYSTTVLADQDQTSPNYLHGSVIHDEETGGVTTSGTEWNNFRNAAVKATFTIYEKYGETTGSGATKVTTWGYYCYYYYWNRHNDNGQNGVLAPMEFAVVRNNVYKLAVTSLNRLGHPRIPENDPDDPTPDTPDEKSDLYMTVSVQVVPWLVRVNNIEF